MADVVLPLRSPHDLREDDTRVILAGRVRRVGGHVIVADAFAQVPVDADGSIVAQLPHDALARIEVARTGRGDLRALRVVDVHVPAASARDTARLLDLGVGRNLRARHRVLRALRDDFEREGFVEVDTPRLVVSPGLDVHLAAFEAPGAGDGGAPLYLITSPEYQMKRLLVGGIPRCFQVTPCFRRDERGHQHNPEFTMLEWYRAFEDVEAVMADTERIVVTAAQAVTPDADAGAPSIRVGDRTIPLARPFRRVTVAQAFTDFAGVDEARMLALADDDPEVFFRILVETVEPALGALDEPVFLCRYPRPFASLARLVSDDPRYAERFELYVAGIELCNGFGELTSASEQRARFVADQAERRASGLPVYPIDERFLDALEGGMPDASGNALGLDRLVALVCGARDLGDVMAFPANER